MDDALVIGLAFACQIMDHLPHDPWDKPVDMVVTEEEIFTNKSALRKIVHSSQGA
jgi:5-formyltetrahydrofolate cyclo-ligase